MSEEEEVQVYKYPKGVIIILTCEILESIAYATCHSYCLKDYLRYELHYKHATDITTCFFGISRIFVLIGALLSDNGFGKFKIATTFFCIYAFALVSFTFSSIKQMELMIELTWIGILGVTVAAGNEGCVCSLGGDMFKMPQQTNHLEKYFAMYKSCTYTGFIVAYFYPHIHIIVQCLNQNTCYSLSFLISTTAMLAIVVLLFSGKNLLVERTRVVVRPVFFKLIFHAINKRFNREQNVRKQHWLDYAYGKYTEDQIISVKAVGGCMAIFSTTMIYYIIKYFQIFTRARQIGRMDDKVGSYTLTSVDVEFMRYVLTMFFIVTLEFGLFPLLRKLQIQLTVLQKIGGALLILIIANVISLFIGGAIKLTSPDYKISILYQIPHLISVSLSSALIEVQGAFFAYMEAPYEMKATVMALWLIFGYAGMKLEWLLDGASYLSLNESVLGIFFTMLCVFNFAFFLFISSRYTYKSFTN